MKKSSYVFVAGVALSLLAASYVTSRPASPVRTTSLSTASTCCRAERPGLRTYTFKRIPSSAIHHGHAAVPNMRITRSASLNWSGYAVPASGNVGPFTEVQGSWSVPEVVRTKGGQAYSAAWVGIDGYDSGTVEQIGTEHDWSGNSAAYYAWFEMYPAYGYEIVGFPVNPGDEIRARVSVTTDSDGNQVFSLAIANVSAGIGPVKIPAEYTTVPAASPAQLSSAEWVMEAPSFMNRVLNLADFGTIQFSGCSANGHSIDFYQNKGLDPITLVGTKGNPGTRGFKVYTKDVPSDLSDTGFSVTWEHQ